MGAGGAPGVSPVVISDQELTVISVQSSDTDPDSEEGCMSDSQSEPASPIPMHIPGQVVVSPSHFPAPAEPLSAVSSVLISPNRVQEDVSSDVYPIYEVSPDTTGYVPSTAPGGPMSSAVSLPLSDPESLLPVAVDGVIACDLNLLDPGTDLSLLAFLTLVTCSGRDPLTPTVPRWTLGITLWCPMACWVAPIV